MKFTYNSKGAYSEIGQPNSIRWAILSGTPEDGFVNESSWLKCKDFFNDYVVAYNGGKRFSIYCFSTEKMTIPAKGVPVYMAVKDVCPSFEHNIKILNLPQSIEMYECEHVFILKLDELYFRSTYNISLLSLMIRLCNIEHKFKDYTEFVEYKEHPKQDQDLWDNVVKHNYFFDIPEPLQQYIWYEGPKYNDKVFQGDGYQLSSLVHNCGIIAYSKFF